MHVPTLKQPSRSSRIRWVRPFAIGSALWLVWLSACSNRFTLRRVLQHIEQLPEVTMLRAGIDQALQVPVVAVANQHLLEQALPAARGR